MSTFDVLRVRAAYDEQVRRSQAADGTGAVVEVAGGVVRWEAVDGYGWSGITWSDLHDGDADDAIAAQVAHFAARNQSFAWQLYDYDFPADLSSRLVAAGFVRDDDESLMIADVSVVPRGDPLPEGVQLMPVTDEAGVGLLIEVHERVFGSDHSQLRRSLIAQLRQPSKGAMVVAMADDQPVSSARIDFLPNRDFARLWGGSTLPAWRGKGIYRALVAYRAELAAARGYRYLPVDASSQSQPILGRLGFVAVASVTRYVWTPPAPG